MPAIESGGFAPFLIHGVTGSGKTEVYLAAIEASGGARARGDRAGPRDQPDAADDPPVPPAVRPGRRAAQPPERRRAASALAEHRLGRGPGRRRRPVGGLRATRRLGLIVIDEEHESTFKQETTPRYHARDVAVKRAQMEGMPVILGSATPSLESWRNAERGRYTRLSMPSRVGDRPMPEVEIIDLRNEKTVVGGL